jgi:hypothetical protein
VWVQGCGQVFYNFHSPSQNTLGLNLEIVIERGRNWFVFNSPIMYSTHIWRVGEWLSAPLECEINHNVERDIVSTGA